MITFTNKQDIVARYWRIRW